jgi:hypothetical protein
MQFVPDAYASAQGNARAVLGTNPQYTISFWIDASAAPTTARPILDFSNQTVAPYGGVRLSYVSATQLSVCAASTSSAVLGGSCPTFAAPGADAWHNIIVRYNATGTGPGQGGNVDVYEDGALAATVVNDASNDPVFNATISTELHIGAGGVSIDEVRVYTGAFTPATQCATIIGGTWSGTACTLP